MGVGVIFMVSVFSYGQGIIQQVCVKDSCVQVEIADTDAKREAGLMYRESLPENKGMLFIFDYEAPHGFWMKNTYFPLDIIWIDKDKRIVDIKANASLCKEICENFFPRDKALYVLEVNAGFAERHKIKIGDKVSFDAK